MRKKNTGSPIAKGKLNPEELKKLKENIAQHLNVNSKRTFTLKQIYKLFEIKESAKRVQTIEVLNELLDDQMILLTEDNQVMGNVEMPIMTGKVDFVNSKYAFIITESEGEDIWVAVDDLLFALDGDTVRVQVFPQKKGKKLEGRVLYIIERYQTEFVGRIEISSKFAFVIPDHRKMYVDIYIPKNELQNVSNGHKVIVKIIQWHTAKNNPVGTLVKVLGKAGEHDTEMHAILAEYNLPTQFPKEILEEAENISDKITEAEIKKRRDFRNITTFTIDPYDAKDFDDALSVQKLKNGNWEVGVHIADVTHYIKPGTRLQTEAYNRATSVYLVDRVVPMLPERLSNDLCSLRPKEDKLTFSAVFELDQDANIINEWFGKTIIHSDRRYSYEEAQSILESNIGDYHEELTVLNSLAKTLTAKRYAQGAINFETVEVKFRLDEHGYPIELYVKERKDAHRLIEEFMLLANKRVAEFTYKLSKEKASAAMVYRVHEKPDEEKLRNFAGFAQKFGYEISLNGNELARSLNQFVEQVQLNPQQAILQNLAIRTMAKAKYTIQAIGHFGLAFSHYTHFTSPIRRYPDMMVHYLLEQYLNKEKINTTPDEWEAQCKHSSDMEKRAADAERASIKYKQVEYMRYLTQQQIEEGQLKSYEGVITGLTEWGIYVEILETRCEGMIRMNDLYDDFYELEAENYRIIGKRTGRVISFGDKMYVKVKNTDLERRTMDLIPSDLQY